MVKLVPQVGDLWVEKARQGRTVEILKCGWNTYRFGRKAHQVEYRTTSVHNKRAQSMPSISDLSSFQQRFEKCYPQLEDLCLNQPS